MWRKTSDERRDTWPTRFYEIDFINDPITGKFDKEPIEQEEKRVTTVQLAERLMMSGQVPTIKHFTGEQKKQVYCRDDATQTGMRGSKSYVEHCKL